MLTGAENQVNKNTMKLQFFPFITVLLLFRAFNAQ